jgi:iron complex outermembrane receptor protein
VQAASKYPTCAPPDSFNYAGACRYDYTHYIDIYPESSRTSALLRGVFQIDADNQLFADYAYSNNKIILGLSQTPSTTTGVRSRYPYPFGGKYYPTAAVQAVSPGYTGDLAVSWRIVDGGQRRDQVIADTRRLLLGAEGTLVGWDYNAAFTLSEAKASDNYISGYYSDKLLVAALKTGNVNPFGPNDATGLALLTGAEIRGSIRDSKTSNNGFDFRASREIFNAPAGPVGFAFGGELRRETYLDGYTELAASGDIVGGSGTAGAVEGSRNIRGIFTEVSVPLIKGLDLQAAVRNDAYTNGSGSSRDGAFKSADYSATSPKIALRFQPLKSVLLRASMGQGFRAPALDNLYSPASFTNTGGQYNDPFYNALKNCASPTADTNRCAAQLTVQNNSNPNLKPEKSKQTSLGLALEPLDDLNLTVDYFDIKITNGITALTGDSILQDWYARQTGGPNSATSASPFANRLIKDSDGYLSYVAGSLENLAEARVAGYDVTLKYKLRTSFGNFSPKWEATYLTKSTTTNTVTGDVGDNLGQYARGGPALKLKQVYSLEYETGPWTFFGRLYKQSGYRDYDDGSLAVVPYVDTYSLVDVNVSFKGIKNVTLSAGVRNLLDKKPPVSIQQDYFQVGFDPTYSDVKLRTMFFRGTYKF